VGIGIGGEVPAGILHVSHTDSSETGLFERVTASGSAPLIAMRLRSRTSADMAAGFGAGIEFQIEDNSGVPQNAAFIGTQRHTVDNSSHLVFQTASLGTQLERMRIASGGFVGIGTDDPQSQLHVSRSTGLPLTVERAGNGSLIRFRSDGSSVGSITVSSGTVSYNNFTGSHLGWIDQPPEFGSLVVLTGDNGNLHNDPTAEVIYGIAPCSERNQQTVLGAFLGLQEPEQPPGPENPYLVMAEGNGEVWVTDAGGDIHTGDYLISSPLAGHAQRDDRISAESHVFARAAEAVRWSEVALDSDGIKRQRISILFGSFARSNPR